MDKEIDKTLNRKTDFKYPPIDAKRQARLLRFSPGKVSWVVNYHLEVVLLADLSCTNYKALSYTWGHASIVDIPEIQIDDQPFFIRRNLFEFLATAAARSEYGSFFIDAICINQLDDCERQSQVQEMARIYRNANQVIAWLGLPDPEQLDHIQALSQKTRGTSCRDCSTWTNSQWAGFKYLSYHNFWRRIWIVQEVLLASSMVVWCGAFTFPLALFGSTPSTLPSLQTKIAANGRPSNVISAVSRLRSPAETIVTHRLRQAPLPRRERDPLAQGTKIGTIGEMMTGLRSASEVMATYQSQVPDLLYQVVRKFGRLDCSDPRDRLYGLLGILNERSREKIEPDYRRDVRYACYQALKIGLQELSFEKRSVVFPDHFEDTDHTYLAYYCDVRDAFSIEDGVSLSILRQVLNELQFPARLQDAIFEVQWQPQLVWRNAEVKIDPIFKQLVMQTAQENLEAEGLLFKFHTGQHRVIEGL
ncbi:hypothetical protein G7Y89_g8272 [Cudoniella acicularis]|uniref:Heterokaryon incompatibility domain-containing protein n=1 Tax=Cudoniella acicularis TaxID=354080 RepID=A0A8H4W3R3_9HELO|nr:hypothetical protein G7Y89_g8272 [Cudoniella acicularis]